VFGQILGWLSSWPKTFIANAVLLGVLKNMRQFEFPAAPAHNPPTIGRFSGEWLSHSQYQLVQAVELLYHFPYRHSGTRNCL